MTPTLPGDLTSPTAGALLPPEGDGHDWHGLLDLGTSGLPWRGVILLDVDEHGHALVWRPGEPGLHHTTTAALHLPLDRDPVRDHVTRWLARHHGLTVGVTAPGWWRAESHSEGEPIAYWVLSIRVSWTKEILVYFFSGDDCDDGADASVSVPGISKVTDAAEAMSLACLSAGGRLSPLERG